MAAKLFRRRPKGALRSEVKEFICACESLQSAIDRHTAFSQEELRLIKLYSETTEQSAAGLFIDIRTLGLGDNAFVPGRSKPHNANG
jgi:hypothetical protein